MLKAHGGYILPENVPANEFLNLEGDKISTSRNWAVWLHEYLEEFPGKEDVLRYVLCANAPETKDNDFTWKDFQALQQQRAGCCSGEFRESRAGADPEILRRGGSGLRRTE